MKRVSIFISILLIAMVGAISCSTNTPAKRAVRFNKLINDGKIVEAVEFVHIEATDSLEMVAEKAVVKQTIEEKIAARYAQKGGVKRFKVISESVAAGGNAYVEVQLVYRDGTIEKARDNFVQDENGEWKATLARF